MKIRVLFVVAMACVSSTAKAQLQCDRTFTFPGTNGETVTDCRIEGARAEQIYSDLHAPEERVVDADGAFGGFKKTDGVTSCFASEHKTSFQCDELLAVRGAKNGQVCALTNGIDACSPQVPCCDSSSVCTSDTGAGFCD